VRMQRDEREERQVAAEAAKHYAGVASKREEDAKARTHSIELLPAESRMRRNNLNGKRVNSLLCTNI
jgi:hypothetical protein